MAPSPNDYLIKLYYYFTYTISLYYYITYTIQHITYTVLLHLLIHTDTLSISGEHILNINNKSWSYRDVPDNILPDLPDNRKFKYKS